MVGTPTDRRVAATGNSPKRCTDPLRPQHILSEAIWALWSPLFLGLIRGRAFLSRSVVPMTPSSPLAEKGQR